MTLKKILIIVFGVILIVACNKRNSYKDNEDNEEVVYEEAKTPEQLKEILKLNESVDPTKYVTVTDFKVENNKVDEDIWTGNPIYDGYLLKGTIHNSASVAIFKDVKLQLQIISKTNTVIKTEEFTVYEYFEPNFSKSFAVKFHSPQAGATCDVKVMEAIPIY